MLNSLQYLIDLARKRKSFPIEGSYTNKLLDDKSLSREKIQEEIKELIEAVEENKNKIHEAADVFFHLIMYLEANNIEIEKIMEELDKRKIWENMTITIYLLKYLERRYPAKKNTRINYTQRKIYWPRSFFWRSFRRRNCRSNKRYIFGCKKVRYFHR